MESWGSLGEMYKVVLVWVILGDDDEERSKEAEGILTSFVWGSVGGVYW